jgi:hypothetical protein
MVIFFEVQNNPNNKPKVAVSIPIAAKQTFLLAQCGHTWRQHHTYISSPENITPETEKYKGIIGTLIPCTCNTTGFFPFNVLPYSIFKDKFNKRQHILNKQI